VIISLGDVGQLLRSCWSGKIVRLTMDRSCGRPSATCESDFILHVIDRGRGRHALRLLFSR
jgi:hypothetical protein